MRSETKKKRARLAAAKYATNLPAAISEYLRLTGQAVEQFSEKDIAKSEELQKAREEMLSLLKPYRHPTFDVFGERMIFSLSLKYREVGR